MLEWMCFLLRQNGLYRHAVKSYRQSCNQWRDLDMSQTGEIAISISCVLNALLNTIIELRWIFDSLCLSLIPWGQP